MTVDSGTNWSKLLRRVHQLLASPAQISLVEPPGLYCLVFLLLLILNKTLNLPFHSSVYPPFCQNYHQCLGLVWTCDRSITLHFTDLRMQRVLEWKRQAQKKKERKKRGGQGRGRRSEQYHRKKEGSSFHAAKVFTCHIEEALHVPAPSGRRGGPCVARKATRTMQLGLVVLAMIFLSSMGHGNALKLSKARRQRRGEFSLSQLVFVSPFFLFGTAGFHFCGLSHSGACLINI